MHPKKNFPKCLHDEFVFPSFNGKNESRSRHKRCGWQGAIRGSMIAFVDDCAPFTGARQPSRFAAPILYAHQWQLRLHCNWIAS
jgi:hypothetical protein